MVQLSPCGMLLPHYHPRTSNYLLTWLGTTHTYAIEENDAHIMKIVLMPGKMTIFLQGPIADFPSLGMQIPDKKLKNLSTYNIDVLTLQHSNFTGPILTGKTFS
jgi:hypothetical protein